MAVVLPGDRVSLPTSISTVPSVVSLKNGKFQSCHKIPVISVCPMNCCLGGALPLCLYLRKQVSPMSLCLDLLWSCCFKTTLKHNNSKKMDNLPSHTLCLIFSLDLTCTHTRACVHYSL